MMAGLSTGLTAKLVDRFGSKPVMYPGMVLAAVGLLLFASAGPHAEYFPKIFIAFVMLGLGAGLTFMPLLQIGMSEVPNEDAGLGSGVVNVSQQLAGAVGLAALSTIAANSSKSLLASGHDVISALTHGYQLALLIAACSVIARARRLPVPLAHQRVGGGAGHPHPGEHGQPRGQGAPDHLMPPAAPDRPAAPAVCPRRACATALRAHRAGSRPVLGRRRSRSDQLFSAAAALRIDRSASPGPIWRIPGPNAPGIRVNPGQWLEPVLVRSSIAGP